MHAVQRSSTGPFLLVLACLFVLSLIAPRTWEQIARDRPLGDLPFVAPRDGQTTTRTRRAAALPPVPQTLAGFAPPSATEPASRGMPTLAPPEPSEVVAQVPAPVELPIEPPVAYRPTESIALPKLELPPRPRHTQVQLEAEPSSEPSWWPVPDELLARVEHLVWRHETSEWAIRTSDLVWELTRTTGPHDPRAGQILSQLRRLAEAPEQLVPQGVDGDAAVKLRLAQHALVRRLDLWEPALALASLSGSVLAQQPAQCDPLATCLEQIALATEQAGEVGQSWQRYLLLDMLQQAAAEPAEHGDHRRLARRVLSRLEQPLGLSVKQHEFISDGPLAELRMHLRRWATEHVDVQRTLADVERFESSGLPSDARCVAGHWQRLSYSTIEPQRQLAHWLQQHYRNANLRVAVSAELLNRLLPKGQPRSEPVQETILGLPTRGWSRTSTDLSVRLVPDEHRLRLELEARGVVFSRTGTTSGPVTVYSDGDSSFIARKELQFTTAGLRALPATADATTWSRLGQIETDFDAIPLLGLLVESIARARHDESAAMARREAELKLSSRVIQQVDAETQAAVARADAELARRVLAPLNRLELRPQPIDLQTTPARLVMRFRLAGDEQLAGDSPRPRAPSDSLLSVQVHRSLLNNAAERLGLAGRRFSLPELHRHLADVLNLPDYAVPDSLPADAFVTFAAADPVRVRCAQGRVGLTLAIAELAKAPHKWRDFVVEVYYAPAADVSRGELVRDGTILLSGARLSVRDQIPLRGIFSKMFPAERRVALLPERLADDARLADVEVTQLEIRDGWIGLALGPRRPRSVEHVARRLDP